MINAGVSVINIKIGLVMINYELNVICFGLMLIYSISLATPFVGRITLRFDLHFYYMRRMYG